MSRHLLHVLVLAALASPAVAQTPALTPPVVAQAPGGMPPVVVTQGEAILKRAPDQAWLTVATETRDPRAAEARRKNAEAMTAVQAALKGAGVAADAIRTTGYSLMPEMDWNDGRGILRGYVVRNQIEVRVDDLERLPAVLDAANSPKGVALTINGPRFSLKDTRTVEREALGLAVAAALARAEAIASGAKRSLGPILRVDDQPQGHTPPQPVMMRMAAADSASTPITPGEVEVRAQVTVTVELR